MKKIKPLILLTVILFGMSLLSSCDSLMKDPNNGNDTPIQDTDQKEVIYKLAVESGYTGTYEEWLESIKGKSVELSVQEGVICWRHQGDADWKILINVSSLKGEDGLNGKEIELNVSPTHIQW